MFRIPRKVRYAAASGFLLIGMAGAAVIGAVEASAATACPIPLNPAPGQAAKNIDTSLGCDNPSGAASNPATGWIAITMPGGIFGPNQATLRDFFIAYDGTYTATFTSCSGGTASGATYVIVGGNIASGTPSFWTTSIPGGTMFCQYSVAYAGTPPSGATTLQNQAVFVTATNVGIFASSPVVQTFAAPLVPEVPLAVLLPVAGVLVLVVFLGLRWRQTRTRPPVVIQ